MNTDNVVELEPGCSGKAALLEHALREIIYSEAFNDMTLAEVLGALELVKYTLISHLD